MNSTLKILKISAHPALIGIVIALCLFEVLAFYFPKIGYIATQFWILSFVPVALYSLFCIYSIVKYSATRKSFLTLGMIATVFFVIILGITDSRNSNFETTQEIGCTLNQLENDEDNGYRSTCLFGYPTRQYLIPSLPSILFGRNQINLNVGGGLYFSVGLSMFTFALIRFLKKNPYHDTIAAIAISLLPHFYYFNHFVLAYEQSIFPLSFSLMMTGLFLNYVQEKNKLYIALLTIILYHAAFLYTPALALLILALGVLIYQIVLDKTRAIFFTNSIPIFIIFFAFFASYFVRTDIKIIESSRSLSVIASDIISGIQHILLPTQGTSYTTGVTALLFIYVIFSPLFLIYGKKLFFISIWILGVITVSIISKGYSFYSIDFRLHRAMIIIPIFLSMFIYMVNKIQIYHHKQKYLLLSLFFIVSCTGLLNFIFYQNSKTGSERHRHYAFIQWANNHAPKGFLEKKNIILFNANDTAHFVSISDNLRYYFPQVEVVNGNDNCESFIVQKLPKQQYIFVTKSSDKNCIQDAIRNGKYLGEFKFLSDPVLKGYLIQ